MRYYNHQAIEADREPGETIRECRVCGAGVIGMVEVGTLKHHDEIVATIVVPREWMTAVRQASDTVGVALGRVSVHASDEERARAVTIALYEAGLLRQKAVRPKVTTGSH